MPSGRALVLSAPPGRRCIGQGRMVADQGWQDCLAIDDQSDVVRLTITATDLAEAPLSIGLRFGEVRSVRRYLRNGYHSWDGSFFADPGAQADDTGPEKNAGQGFAMTALTPLDHDHARPLFEAPDVEDALIQWSELVASASSLPGRLWQADPDCILLRDRLLPYRCSGRGFRASGSLLAGCS